MLLEMRIALGSIMLVAVVARASDDPYAAEVFAKNCASCHQSEAGARGRIPQIDVLKTMTSAAIQKTLESGIMKTQAAQLSADERLKLAAFLGITTTQEKSARRSQIRVLPRRTGRVARHSGTGAAISPIRVFNPTPQPACARRTCPD